MIEYRLRERKPVTNVRTVRIKKPEYVVLDTSRELRIILRRCDADKENNPAPSLNVVAAHSNESELDSSVEFVGVEKASKETMQIAKLNRKIAQLNSQNQQISTQFGILQRQIQSVRQNINEEIVIEDEDDEVIEVQPVIEPVPIIQPAEAVDYMDPNLANMDMSDSMALSESFVTAQLQEWADAGELGNVFDQMQQFLNGNH